MSAPAKTLFIRIGVNARRRWTKNSSAPMPRLCLLMELARAGLESTGVHDDEPQRARVNVNNPLYAHLIHLGPAQRTQRLIDLACAGSAPLIGTKAADALVITDSVKAKVPVVTNTDVSEWD